MSSAPAIKVWMAKWAIITGASSGIGRALAFEFAEHGFNLLLTARNESALTEVGAQCRKKFGVETEVMAADLACADSVHNLISGLSRTSREYEVLVNNAGFGIHGDFASTDIERNIDLVNVQLSAALRLTRAVLPEMIRRRSGRILNVASVYSYSPVPLQSVYAACKAFLLSFSSAIQNEIKSTGVSITVFCPGITQTDFRSRAGIKQNGGQSGMTAEAAARIALRATLRGKHIVVPGLVNRLFVFITQLLPVQMVPNLIRFINRQRGV
jgi:short-subunit dehydrogenase